MFKKTMFDFVKINPPTFLICTTVGLFLIAVGPHMDMPMKDV